MFLRPPRGGPRATARGRWGDHLGRFEVIKIDVYHAGSSARVRLHHHPYAADDRCGPECEQESCERAYHPHKGSLADYRKTTIAALVALCLDPGTSHAEWAAMVGEQSRLDI